MKFADKLRYLRNENNLTQEEASKAINVSLRTYKSYELGERRPRNNDTFLNIADRFNIELSSLLDDEKEIEYLWDENLDSKELLDQMLGLFAGGKLSLEDKKTVVDTLEEAYYIAKLKEENNE